MEKSGTGNGCFHWGREMKIWVGKNDHSGGGRRGHALLQAPAPFSLHRDLMTTGPYLNFPGKGAEAQRGHVSGSGRGLGL